MADRETLPTWPAEPAEPIVGREREVQALYDLMAAKRHRLIALTGPPGIGKTRLALAIWSKAARDADAFPGGARYVSVVAVHDVEILLERLADAVGVRVGGARPVAERIAVATGRFHWLVILDGCDQVPGAGIAVGQLLERVPNLTVLLLKRSLGPGSPAFEYALGPLSDEADASAGGESPALRFLRRKIASARTANASGPLDERHLTDILTRGAGDPIAIRLLVRHEALRRSDSSAGEVASPFPLDIAASDDPPTAALREAFRLATESLQPAERRWLRRLAIVPDGWTLASAVAISNRLDRHDQDPSAPNAVERAASIQAQLDRLVATGLVVPGLQANREIRYRVQRCLRDALLEELKRDGEEATLRAAVLEYLTRFVETGRQECFGPRQVAWLNVMADERDNLREALHWVTSDDATAREIVPGVPLVADHVAMWMLQGNIEEGRIWLRRMLAAAERLAPDESAPLRGTLDDIRVASGMLSALQGDLEYCRTILERYPVESVQAEDTVSIRRRLALALIALEVGDTTAARGYLGGIQARIERSAPGGLGRSREALWSAARADLLLSRVFLLTGQPMDAIVPLRRALDRSRRAGDRRATAQVLIAHGDAFAALDEDDRAVARYVEAISISYDLDDSNILSPAMVGLAQLSLKRGAPRQAALWLGSADALRRRAGGAPTQRERARFADLLREIRQALDPEEANAHVAQGARAPLSVVAEVASGFIDFDDAPLREPAAVGPDAPDQALASGLTPLQRDILRLIVIGRMERDIALSVGVRPEVVRAQTRRMIRRLGVSTRLALAAEAIHRRLG